MVERIHQLIRRGHASAGDAFPEWRHLSSVAQAAEYLLTEHCYLLYEHPVHSHRNRLSRASRQDALAFLTSAIQPERFSGLDVSAVPEDFSCVIICNHDGGIFLSLPHEL